MQSPKAPALEADLPKIDVLRVLFPEFEIRGLVGRGGMGAVYRAHHTRLDRPVALKILLPSLAKDTEFAARFTREARAMARLSHPNVVGIHDFGEREDLFFLVMEFVDGPNLRQLIESSDLSTEDAMAIVPQVCDALQYAHDHGVVHRDIKPENILIDEDLRVRISDFGLAKVIDDGAGPSLMTRTEQVFGTPHYMAPEQMRGTGSVDFRADIYSLGVVIYEMLTGELPIGRFDPPSSREGIHADMDRVVMKSLASEPGQRYQSASEVKAAVGGQPATSRSAGGMGAARGTAEKRSGEVLFSRFDLLLGPGAYLKKKDLPWFAFVALLIVFFSMFFPYYYGPVKYGQIHGYNMHNMIEMVKGWDMWMFDLPMFMLFLYGLAFLIMTLFVAYDFPISARWLCIPSGLGAAQTGVLIAIEIQRELHVQIAPIVGCVAFLGMIYIATAKRK